MLCAGRWRPMIPMAGSISMMSSIFFSADWTANSRTVWIAINIPFGFPNTRKAITGIRALSFLQMLEDRLAGNGGQGLCAPRTTFADVATFPFVRQFAFVDKPWFDDTPYPLLLAWFNRHLESDLFLSVMHKYVAWKPGDDVLLFGEQS